jgi:hypothetical protein
VSGCGQTRRATAGRYLTGALVHQSVKPKPNSDAYGVTGSTRSHAVRPRKEDLRLSSRYIEHDNAPVKVCTLVCFHFTCCSEQLFFFYVHCSVGQLCVSTSLHRITKAHSRYRRALLNGFRIGTAKQKVVLNRSRKNITLTLEIKESRHTLLETIGRRYH